MALFVSGYGAPWQSGQQPIGTQCWHRDAHDIRHVKLFYFVTDITERDGPLTLHPAKESTAIFKATRNYWRRAPYRDDFPVWFAASQRPIQLTGPAGTVALVDTSRCLHFGSRCLLGHHRAMFVIHYTFSADYSHGREKRWRDVNLATSPELRLDNLAPWQQAAWRLVED